MTSRGAPTKTIGDAKACTHKNRDWRQRPDPMSALAH
jgi:hypothetical protein